MILEVSGIIRKKGREYNTVNIEVELLVSTSPGAGRDAKAQSSDDVVGSQAVRAVWASPALAVRAAPLADGSPQRGNLEGPAVPRPDVGGSSDLAAARRRRDRVYLHVLTRRCSGPACGRPLNSVVSTSPGAEVRGGIHDDVMRGLQAVRACSPALRSCGLLSDGFARHGNLEEARGPGGPMCGGCSRPGAPRAAGGRSRIFMSLTRRCSGPGLRPAAELDALAPHPGARGGCKANPCRCRRLLAVRAVRRPLRSCGLLRGLGPARQSRRAGGPAARCRRVSDLAPRGGGDHVYSCANKALQRIGLRPAAELGR